MADDAQETVVNPSAALNAAARLTVAGEDFASRLTDLQSQITSLSARKPWGNDAVGQEFERNYDGGDTPAETTLLTALGDLANALSQTGPNITASVTGTVSDDEATGRSMQV